MENKFLSSFEFAEKWGMTDRSVRRYCKAGKIEGAFLVGKTWRIPAGASQPQRKNAKRFSDNGLLNILKEEKDMGLKGGIYHKTQVNLAYNSNRIEGSKLTEDQTRHIFEMNTIGVSDKNLNVDDIIETTNHFKCLDHVIETAKTTLDEAYIKKLHLFLKANTSDGKKKWFRVGDYKLRPNEVGGEETCLPENVQKEMQKLLESYNLKKVKAFEDIVEFHHSFEKIHPFQDGNGRVGRLIIFKECLSNNVVPFIIDDEHKLFYYRGLKEWKNERGFLIETCLSAQDMFKEWLKYFRIKF